MEAVWLMSARVAGRICISSTLSLWALKEAFHMHIPHEGRVETHCRDAVHDFRALFNLGSAVARYTAVILVRKLPELA